MHKSFKVISGIILMMTSKFNKKLVIKKLTDDNYEPDKRHKDLFESLAKLREKFKQEDFQDWLISETREGFVVKNILNKMISEMINVIKNDGYLIKDKKAFRDYIASYIYREC